MAAKESRVRDIRDDLKERLASLDARMSDAVRDYNRDKAELDKRLAETERRLDDERKTTSALLQIEQRRYGEEKASPVAIPNEPLPEFLIRQAALHGPMFKEDLHKAAATSGYFLDGEGGRTMHTTLLNLVRGNRLIQTIDGLYHEPGQMSMQMEGMEKAKEPSLGAILATRSQEQDEEVTH